MSEKCGRQPRSMLVTINTLKCTKKTSKSDLKLRVALQSHDRKAQVRLYCNKDSQCRKSHLLSMETDPKLDH